MGIVATSFLSVEKPRSESGIMGGISNPEGITVDHLTITRPDDWHIHLRDGDALATTVPHAAAQFGRAIVMPNLKPPIRTVAEADTYRTRILAALPAGMDFEPLMTLYLTDTTTAQTVIDARASLLKLLQVST